MKRIIAVIFTLIMIFSLVGCSADVSTTHIEAPSDSPVKISYTADFYDNYGSNWLSVEGNSFDISPNKVKDYYYDSEGTWTYKWNISSVMSVTIDSYNINSCGSTIIFADSRLKKIDIDIPTDVDISSGDSADISVPNDLMMKDYWSLNWWWEHTEQADTSIKSRIVIVQSQNGDPICMYQGNNVEWQVSENLPKTTELTIDGMKLFIHRANFSTIDTALFSK